MNKTLWTAGAVFAFVLSATTSLLAQTPWIHVEVNEGGEEASHVKVNLPLSVVQVAMEAAPEKIMKEGHIRIESDENDLDLEDLRRMWKELRATGDSELVSVEKEDQTVSIRRQGDLVLVDVDDRKENEKVQVQMPVAVVDALLSGEGQELNVKDALSALRSLRGDIVRVDGHDKVRIWIDEKD